MEHKKFLIPFAALSVMGLANAAHAARGGDDRCAPVPPAPCYSVDTCEPTFCLGPEMVNPAVRPCTCDGDFVLTIAGFYWNTHEDGLEYAVKNGVATPVVGASTHTADVLALNNLVSARYETPDFDWDFGFKLGAGYNTNHDGWDIGVLWTWYKNSADDRVEAHATDNTSLIAIWSAYAPPQGSVLYADDINSHWKLELNLVDIELGREMWMSKYLTFRPFIGLRVAFINQLYKLEHRGGSWSADTANFATTPAFNNFVDMKNHFKGAGVRGGFDTVWNFGRGWAFYGNLAADLVYGKFSISHEEKNLVATTFSGSVPHNLGDKVEILETTESFHATRAMLDMALGVQWATLFSECRYCFTFQLGWEHHMFFDQNQMWRVVRIGDSAVSSVTTSPPNNSGENVYHQRRGDLDTQGWTLTLKFGF